MARKIFPDEGSALVITSHGFGLPLLSGEGLRFTVYSNQAGTALANILTMNNQPILGSVITVDAHSQIPDFLGPDGLSELWVRQEGQTETQSILSRYPTAPQQAGSNVPPYHHDQVDPASEWTIDHNRDQSSVAVSFRDEDGTPFIAYWSVVNTNRIVVSLPSPMIGSADLVF